MAGWEMRELRRGRKCASRNLDISLNRRECSIGVYAKSGGVLGEKGMKERVRRRHACEVWLV